MAATLHNLALVERAEGNPIRAIAHARRALEIKVRLLGRDHPDTALSAMNPESLLGDNAKEARGLLDCALLTFEKTLAADHPHLALCRRLIARAGR